MLGSNSKLYSVLCSLQCEVRLPQTHVTPCVHSVCALCGYSARQLCVQCGNLHQITRCCQMGAFSGPDRCSVDVTAPAGLDADVPSEVSNLTYPEHKLITQEILMSKPSNVTRK